jgi:hypothetical protein
VELSVAPEVRHLHPLPLLRLCPRSLARPSEASSAIMEASLITPSTLSSSLSRHPTSDVCPYTSPQNGKTERMIRTTNDVMCFPFQPATRLRAFTLPPTFSISYPLRRSQPHHPTLPFSTPLPPMPTSGSSDAPDTRTPLPPLPVSSPLFLTVFSLGTPLSI